MSNTVLPGHISCHPVLSFPPLFPFVSSLCLSFSFFSLCVSLSSLSISFPPSFLLQGVVCTIVMKRHPAYHFFSCKHPALVQSDRSFPASLFWTPQLRCIGKALPPSLIFPFISLDASGSDSPSKGFGLNDLWSNQTHRLRDMQRHADTCADT